MFKNNRMLFCKNFSITDATTLLNNFRNAPKNEQNPIYQSICNKMKQHVYDNYINPISKFIKATQQDTDRELYGFMIMGVNCILIEFYFELIHGLDTSNSYGHKTIDAYIEILALLDKSINEDLSLAKIFYKGIRCGILHQGHTKQNTAITFELETIIQSNGGYYLCNPQTLFNKMKILYDQLFNKLANTNCHTINGKYLILKYSYILKSMDETITPIKFNANAY